MNGIHDHPATVPVPKSERKRCFKLAAARFAAMPNAENWAVLKGWMLYLQAPSTMNYAQARRAFQEARDVPFDVTL